MLSRQRGGGAPKDRERTQIAYGSTEKIILNFLIPIVLRQPCTTIAKMLGGGVLTKKGISGRTRLP